jgi:hypothetical protein
MSQNGPLLLKKQPQPVQRIENCFHLAWRDRGKIYECFAK